MNNFVIFGPPGAGKGTQSALLVEKYNLRHISTGSLLRKEIEKGTELGMVAKGLIEKGFFVDDQTVLNIIKKELGEYPNVNGFIFDGYPRNTNQAQQLDNLLLDMGLKVNAVVSLVIDDDLIVKRIAHRALIEGRRDDADIAVIQQRITTYHAQTEPLIDYYKKQHKYFEIEGDSTIEKNFEDICNLIENLKNE